MSQSSLRADLIRKAFVFYKSMFAENQLQDMDKVARDLQFIMSDNLSFPVRAAVMRDQKLVDIGVLMGVFFYKAYSHEEKEHAIAFVINGPNVIFNVLSDIDEYSSFASK